MLCSGLRLIKFPLQPERIRLLKRAVPSLSDKEGQLKVDNEEEGKKAHATKTQSKKAAETGAETGKATWA
jgi:hypothetical protein